MIYKYYNVYLFFKAQCTMPRKQTRLLTEIKLKKAFLGQNSVYRKSLSLEFKHIRKVILKDLFYTRKYNLILKQYLPERPYQIKL
jgi:hypothetical protein